MDPAARKKLDYLGSLIVRHTTWCPHCGPGKPPCRVADQMMRDEERVYRLLSGQPPLHKGE